MPHFDPAALPAVALEVEECQSKKIQKENLPVMHYLIPAVKNSKLPLKSAALTTFHMGAYGIIELLSPPLSKVSSCDYRESSAKKQAISVGMQISGREGDNYN